MAGPPFSSLPLGCMCVSWTLGGRAVWHPELVWSLTVQKGRESTERAFMGHTGAGSYSRYRIPALLSPVSCKTSSRSPNPYLNHVSPTPLMHTHHAHTWHC